MFGDEFQRHAGPLEGQFGTENVGPLLYSLMRMVRPRGVLEVGAGYTTLCMLQALRDNVVALRAEREITFHSFGRTETADDPYDPILITLDDMSHGDNTAAAVGQAIDELGFEPYSRMFRADFHGFSVEIDPALLPLDFVWFDCGGFPEYIDFMGEYWPLCNAAGGIIVLHSTMTNAELAPVLIKLQELHRRRGDGPDSFEILNLVEPHKKLQNSATVIRLTGQAHTPIYTYHP